MAQDEEDRDTLAAEYVLGVLDAVARERAAGLMRADPAFAALVEGWQARLDPLGSAYGEAAPPPHLKGVVARRLFGAQAAPAPGLWNRVGFWRPAALAASALLALAVGLYASGLLGTPAARLVASLAAEGSPVRYVALLDPAGELKLSHVSGDRGPSRDFELWVIAPGSNPVSLGLVPVGAAVAIVLDDASRSRLAAGATLAISDEPQGGSQTGQPTGPIVAAGPLLGI